MKKKNNNDELDIDIDTNFMLEFQRMEQKLKEIALQQSSEPTGEQDILYVFAKYCEYQGCKDADKYYSYMPPVEYKALFVISNEFESMKIIKDLFGLKETMHSFFAEGIAERAIIEGMALKMDYHDIFKMAKERVNQFAALIGVSTVPSGKAIEAKKGLTLLPS